MPEVIESFVAVCESAYRSSKVLAVDELSGKLAIVRKSKNKSNGDYVEVYNILPGWLAVRENVIIADNGAIESALFVDGILITAHANGSLAFIDPHKINDVVRVQVAASAIWNICIHQKTSTRTTIALVTHSSALIIFDLTARLVLSTLSIGVDTRLFSVASNGQTIAIGALDGIAIVKDNEIKDTLKLDREHVRDPTIAWTVCFYDNTTLACGDSKGNITFWDIPNSSLVQSLVCLQSHVLTMCMNNGVLNAVGVDPRISLIKRMPNGEFDVVQRRNGPVRDVRCIVSYDSKVYVCGDDYELFVGSSGTRQLSFQHIRTSVQLGNEMVVSCADDHVDVWWKETGEDKENNDTIVQHHKPVLLAKIYSPKKKLINSWVLSPCGKFLALSTLLGTTAYHINSAKRTVKKLEVTGPSASAIQISNDFLVIATCDFHLMKIALTGDLKWKVCLRQEGCGVVTKLDLSPDATTAVVVTSRSQVFTVDLEQGESRLVKVDLPIDVCCTSSSTFVLCTQDEFANQAEDKKILFEVNTSNGRVLHSANARQIRMTPNLPTSVTQLNDTKIVVSNDKGAWSIIDLKSKKVVTPKFSESVKDKKGRVFEHSKRVVAVRRLADGTIANPDRLVVLKLKESEPPKSEPFKLKKFGMQ